MSLNIFRAVKESKRPVVINFILYNLSWFITIFGAEAGSAEIGPACTVIVVAIHLLLFKKIWRKELIFIIATMLVGSVLDLPLSTFGFVEFSANKPTLIGNYPIWMTFLWAGFATTLSSSLKWINRRYFLGAIFGAVGGPGSLYAGVELGAASFHGHVSTILLVASFEWALIIPLIIYLHDKIIPLSLLEKADPS